MKKEEKRPVILNDGIIVAKGQCTCSYCLNRVKKGEKVREQRVQNSDGVRYHVIVCDRCKEYVEEAMTEQKRQGLSTVSYEEFKEFMGKIASRRKVYSSWMGDISMTMPKREGLVRVELTEKK